MCEVSYITPPNRTIYVVDYQINHEVYLQLFFFAMTNTHILQCSNHDIQAARRVFWKSLFYTNSNDYIKHWNHKTVKLNPSLINTDCLPL